MSLQGLTIKRTRVPNFTVREKTILTKLVNKRKDVIENKATDTKSILKKKEAWLLIEKDFNRVTNVYKRDRTVLKTAWDNIKAQTRKMQAAKINVQLQSTSKSPTTTSPLQKETILRMVEEIACINTNEKSLEVKEETCLFIKNKMNETNAHKPTLELTHKLYKDGNCDNKSNKNPDTSMEQNDTVPVNDENPHLDTNHLEFHIEVESDDVSHIKTESSNGDTIENIFPTTLHTNSDDFIQLRTDPLNPLESQQKHNVECNILKAMLQTALLEHQAAVINLEAVKLDLALQARRLEQ